MTQPFTQLRGLNNSTSINGWANSEFSELSIVDIDIHIYVFFFFLLLNLTMELWSVVMIAFLLQASLNGDDSNTSLDEAYSNSSLPGLTPEINANQVILQFPLPFGWSAVKLLLYVYFNVEHRISELFKVQNIGWAAVCTTLTFVIM